ncbi:MAG: LysM peptidoglycan-binding domain-containing protein [Planctomycetota bacterium]|nr:MAG: LysM peptidoglycan-binding domain-containing protein [Planctomycetota bacterium]
MGRVEKIVVLSVMFVVVVIFAVTLNTGDTRTDPTRPAPVAVGDTDPDLGRLVGGLPIAGNDEVLAALPSELSATPGPAGPGLREPTPESAALQEVEREAAPLLTSTVDTSEPRPPVRPIRIEPNWDLKSASELERSVNPMLMLYTCRRGDTFEALAQRYYGDPAKASLLRQNNEGLILLKDGMQILVPVRDDSGPSTTAHRVEDGENLWSIAKRFYGRGSRWGEIYAANRSILKSPDSLKVGMTLTIP